MAAGRLQTRLKPQRADCPARPLRRTPLAAHSSALTAERARCDELRSATYDTADLTGLMCMLSTRFEARSGACTDEPPPLILFEALTRITPADAIGVLERVATHPRQRIL